MSKPTKLSGFPELLPAQRYIEQFAIESLAGTFELHGFGSIETRAVEPLSELLRKGETSKEVYVLKRLQGVGDTADTGLGLHFDLTIPLARYVLENAGKLEFPFRRYQIQTVWRGERPQEGRFREFTQADIDIIGKDELAFHHDVEVARVMVEALSKLRFLPPFLLQVNNRKLIQGFYEGIGAAEPDRVIQLIDKLDKAPPEAIREDLVVQAGLTHKQVDACFALAAINSADLSFVEQVRALGVTNQLLEDGLAELAAVVEGCATISSHRVQVSADLKVARGLDYYTGTVFETRLKEWESLGSICSGGRYDALASDGRTTYPGVGISLGVTRVLVPLINRGAIDSDRLVPSLVLILLPDEESRAACNDLAQQLRSNGTPTEVAVSAPKYGKQIRYAERRGIPYVLFPGGAGGVHEIKDIRSGEQFPVDPTTWEPEASEPGSRIATHMVSPLSAEHLKE
jgi:histidyl-tRNA synthetase